MPIYKLTTWDRLILTQVIGALQGDVKLMRKAGKLLDVIEMTKDERAAVNFREDGGMFIWDYVDKEWDIEIKDPDSIVLLKEKVAAHSWTASQYRQVARLCEVLGIE